MGHPAGPDNIAIHVQRSELYSRYGVSQKATEIAKIETMVSGAIVAAQTSFRAAARHFSHGVDDPTYRELWARFIRVMGSFLLWKGSEVRWLSTPKEERVVGGPVHQEWVRADARFYWYGNAFRASLSQLVGTIPSVPADVLRVFARDRSYPNFIE